MQSTYSWMGSPVQLVLEDQVAVDYNAAVDAYVAAQTAYFQATGAYWLPSQDVTRYVGWSVEQQRAYHDVQEVIQKMADLSGGVLEIPDSQLTSQYLVKKL